MNKPEIAALEPSVVHLKEGQTVYWCSCGKSKSQPHCDGAHQGTGFQPLTFTAEKEDDYYLCQCKHTKAAPLCDGEHKKLPGYVHKTS